MAWPRVELPSKAEFDEARHQVFGQSNPELMDVPFWTYMVRSMADPYGFREHFNVDSIAGPPIWTFRRLGMPSVILEDHYVLSIGGEHEDYYDPDFRIYNDVVVRDFHGDVLIYAYPASDFPPIDFHTANHDEETNSIIIIGGLGYPDSREPWRTPVFRLDLSDMIIRPLEVKGNPPGWIFQHTSVEIGHRVLRVAGGKRITSENTSEPNAELFDLDLTSLTWNPVMPH